MAKKAGVVEEVELFEGECLKFSLFVFFFQCVFIENDSFVLLNPQSWSDFSFCRYGSEVHMTDEFPNFHSTKWVNLLGQWGGLFLEVFYE